MEANHIASWNGSRWSPLGSGTEGGTFPGVNALTVYEDNLLIAGGDFTIAGGEQANNIASWDGSSWSSLDSGIGGGYNPNVNALTVYDGRLIVGGSFSTAGGVEASNIASWDMSDWDTLGSGMDDYVMALTVYEDSLLIAGGQFTTTGGVEANHIASWDGSKWDPLGSGMDNSVEALTVYEENLIAGGYFDTADGVAANCIASWHRGGWSFMGSGIEGQIVPSVQVLTVYKGELIAGGIFALAGNKVSACLAHWTKDYLPSDVVEIDPDILPTDYNMSQSYPNPFNPTTTIEFNLPKRSNVTVTIFNLLGQEVQSLVDEELSVGNYKVTWDGSTSGGAHASTGVYFYRIVTEDFVETKKMVLLK